MGFIMLGSHHNDRKGHYLSGISKSIVFLYNLIFPMTNDQQKIEIAHFQVLGNME